MARTRAARRHIAFLRGINVGGHRVKMDQLRALFEGLKLSNVATFIASGNVIFDTAEPDTAALERRIEAHLEASLGYEVATYVRTPAELAQVAAFRPFEPADLDAPGHSLYVGFLRAAPSGAAVETIRSFRTEKDALEVRGREVFWLCRGRMVDSLIPWPKLEKAAALRATLRNITTVRKLAERYPAE